MPGVTSCPSQQGLAPPQLPARPLSPLSPLQVGADVQPGPAGGSRPRQAPMPGVWGGGGQAVLPLPQRVVLHAVRQPPAPRHPTLQRGRVPEVLVAGTLASTLLLLRGRGVPTALGGGGGTAQFPAERAQP